MIMKSSRKRRADTGEASSSCGKSNKQSLSVMFLLTVIISFCKCLEARPGLETMRLITKSTINAAGQQSPQFPTAGSLRQDTPKTDSQLTIIIAHKHLSKRSLVYERQEDTEEHLKRYPISQVDFDHVKTPFIIAAWILSAGIAKIVFHMFPRLQKIIPESCLLIVVGIIIGCIIYFTTNKVISPLTPTVFFLYMLPPIILDAGYFMPNRKFFDNLGTILLMAVVGTIFNIVTIGGSIWACGLTGVFGDEDMTPKFLDSFLFASLIAAVDPVAVLAVFEQIHVNEVLYIVVFGESLLNDAVTVVMYHMMEAYNEIGISNIIPVDIVSGVASFFVVALGGTIIGVIWGFLTGLVTRFTDHVRVIEPIFVFVMAYLSYLNAEMFHMSGILAITFCGMTMKNYVESNISQKSRTTVKYTLKMLSSSSETIIFIFLGVATIHNNHVWNTWFVVLTILFCVVYRTIGVILLTAIINRFRLHKLSGVEQFVMCYGGLRGAVAFALVLLIDGNVVKQKDMFVTTTIAVIYFTVFLQGITIGPLVEYLDVKRSDNRQLTMNDRIHKRFIDHVLAGIESIVGDTGKHHWRDSIRRFNDRFIKPYLIKDVKHSERKIIETYSKLTLQDAMFMLHRNASFTSQMTGNSSHVFFRNHSEMSLKDGKILQNWRNESRFCDFEGNDDLPLRKILTDAEIHHMLSEQLRPYKRHRTMDSIKKQNYTADLSELVPSKRKINFRRFLRQRNYRQYNQRNQEEMTSSIKRRGVSFTNVKNEELTFDVPKAADDATEDVGLSFTVKPNNDAAAGPTTTDNRFNNSNEYMKSNETVIEPSATETSLPWKRDFGATDVRKQTEFPMWISGQNQEVQVNGFGKAIAGEEKDSAKSSHTANGKPKDNRSRSSFSSNSTAEAKKKNPKRMSNGSQRKNKIYDRSHEYKSIGELDSLLKSSECEQNSNNDYTDYDSDNSDLENVNLYRDVKFY